MAAPPQRPSEVWNAAADAALNRAEVHAARAADVANKDAPVLALAHHEAENALRDFARQCRRRAMKEHAREQLAGEEVTRPVAYWPRRRWRFWRR